MPAEPMITQEELDRLNHIRDRAGQDPLTMERFAKAMDHPGFSAAVTAWLKCWRELESAVDEVINA